MMGSDPLQVADLAHDHDHAVTSGFSSGPSPPRWLQEPLGRLKNLPKCTDRPQMLGPQWAGAATWKPGLPQRSQEEGQWTWTRGEPVEAAKPAGPPPACLCKFRGAICIGKM